MIQGRIVSINGLPFAKWLQQHRNGDERGLWRTEFNFSSREQLDTSETVVEGPPMSPVPLVSRVKAAVCDLDGAGVR